MCIFSTYHTGHILETQAMFTLNYYIIYDARGENSQGVRNVSGTMRNGFFKVVKKYILFN